VAAVWHGEALDGSGPLEVVDGPPDGGDLARLKEVSDAFTPEYHSEEIYEMAQQLDRKAR
jgi:Mn-containing catalase